MVTEGVDGGSPEEDADTSRPTIMQVLPSLVTGGVERGAADVSAAVVRRGWRSVVVSSGGPMVREIERDGGEHIELPVHSKNPIVMRRNVARLNHLIAKHQVEIVHARSRAPAWSALAACRQTGSKLVTTFHGTYNTGLLGKKTYNAVMTRGDRVIAISEFVRQHMLATYPVEEHRIRVIHRGVDMDRFSPASVSPERVIKLANEWRLPDGMPVIMLPGRLTRWKGQLLLVRALTHLGREDVRCLLVGSDQGRVGYTREIQALARKVGLEGAVHIVGECGDMPAAYMLSDVVVSASTDPEAFGRVVAEGQAMGRPVVAPDHGGAPEIVLPGETGWLYQPGDAHALADAIGTALDLSGSERDMLADAGIDNTRRQFTKDRMTDATLAVYQELLDEVAADRGGPMAA